MESPLVARHARLPAELRLRVYGCLPELAPGRLEVVAPPLTPAVCPHAACCAETLPIYVRNSHFMIQADDSPRAARDRVGSWLRALGPRGLANVRGFQYSHHWQIAQATRWEGHVGFYVRLEVVDNDWQCTTGTYPNAGDMRGMRLESVELLRDIVRQIVVQPMQARDAQSLLPADIDLLAQAVDIVASHPISVFDTEQSELGRKRHREIWSDMERELSALDPRASADAGRQTRRFFTPY